MRLKRGKIRSVGMFDYDVERLRAIIRELIRSNISEEAWTWFKEKSDETAPSQINTSFSLIPRKTGKSLVSISKDQAVQILELRTGFAVEGWAIDRLARVCLLMHVDPSDKDTYFKTVENLFLAAEVNELVALYSSLPLLAYPDLWKMRCAEGVRSNMGSVMEAIMYTNPYPSQYLDEKAWNQMVLRAFFTGKDVNRIAGIDSRANRELACVLSDYAHERWAAKRKVNPQLWRLTTRFMDGQFFSDIKKIFAEGGLREKQAAALTVFHSDYKPAKDLLNDYPDLLSEIKKNSLTWDSLALEEQGALY